MSCCIIELIVTWKRGNKKKKFNVRFPKQDRWRWRGDRIFSSTCDVGSCQDVKMHTLHVLRQWQATRKTQFLRSQHAQLRKWQGKVEAWPSRQKWRSHPKLLIAITLYSPLLLLCLFMVLHWCRVAQDGGPLTATTSTTSAPGRSSHNGAACALLFFR